MIESCSGNLFEADVDALVNPVNTIGVMGKGLALQFRNAYPENNRLYEAAAKRKEIEIGRMFVVQEKGRLIINFPTKQHWRQPSRIEYVESGIADLYWVLRDREIRSVAIPALGCGLGGLDWKDVRPRIVAWLDALPVRALLYEP